MKGTHSNSFYNKEDAKRLMKYDSKFMDELKIIETEFDIAYKKKQEKVKALNAKLVQLDLSHLDLA